MKKWAKILVWIGVIWIILSVIGLTILYFNMNNFIADAQAAASSGSMIKYSGFLSTIDTSAVFTSLLKWFVLLIIPSIILFAIALIWGREK
jgi:hypothetical protein